MNNSDSSVTVVHLRIFFKIHIVSKMDKLNMMKYLGKERFDQPKGSKKFDQLLCSENLTFFKIMLQCFYIQIFLSCQLGFIEKKLEKKAIKKKKENERLDFY